jgi:ketosteroid isomerase-like protein
VNDLDVLEPTAMATAFGQAVAAGDRGALRALLAPDVEFRGLTPSRSWELGSAEEAIETMVGLWFGGERHIDAVEELVTEEIGAVVRVGYRFRASTPDGPAVVEQQAYLEITAGMIGAVRLVCSGYHPVPS